MSDEIDPNVALTARLMEGDESALAELYSANRTRLKRMVDLRLDNRVRQRVDSSDVLQEAFIDLAKKLPDLASRNGMSVYVWLRLVVTERIIDLHRKHLFADKRNVQREAFNRVSAPHDATSFSLAQALLGNDTSVSEKVARQERHAALMEKLSELEPLDREVILLRSFEHLSNDEAAEVLGVTKYTASKRYVRALTRLRKLLTGFPGFENSSDINDPEPDQTS